MTDGAARHLERLEQLLPNLGTGIFLTIVVFFLIWLVIGYFDHHDHRRQK